MNCSAIAIDLGGSHATLAIVRGPKLLATRQVAMDSSRGLRPELERFAAVIRELLRETGMRAADTAGIALGFCGLADARTGRVVSTNQKYEDATEIDFRSWARESFHLPFAIENDARMALLGERYAGGARGVDNVVMITLGTGIGGAAMIEGKLLRGKHAQAGCLGGHLPAKVDGRACTCGAVGCAEAEASGWALPFVVREWAGFAQSALANESAINFRNVFEAADAGDRVAREVRDFCLTVWSSAAVGLIHAYDPEYVVIGGGVMKRADLIVPFVQQYTDGHAWTPWGKVKIVAAELGNNAGLFGAVPLLSGEV